MKFFFLRLLGFCSLCVSLSFVMVLLSMSKRVVFHLFAAFLLLSACSSNVSSGADDSLSFSSSVVSDGVDSVVVADSVARYPAGFVCLTDLVPDVILDLRYFSTYNFVGRRIDGYNAPVAICTREAAYALSKASSSLKEMGYRLKIFDAYRPARAALCFRLWSRVTDDTLMKRVFYPDIPKNLIYMQGFLARHSAHSRGSTFDLTLFDVASGQEVDMGSPFDFFGERSHFSSPNITAKQARMRRLLRDVMSSAGFKPIEGEWWHFSLRNEPFPDTYFDFPVE